MNGYYYAGLDFLLDSELNLVFLEANAVPGGIYVMDCAKRALIDHSPSLRNSLFFRGRIVSRLVDDSIRFYRDKKGTYPRLVAVTTPLLGGPLLQPERVSIVREFILRGISAYIVNRKKYFVLGDTFVMRFGSKFIVPDMIIRRNTEFPSNIRQIVINDKCVGYITGSKIRTYNTIGNGASDFRVPKTFYAKSYSGALKHIERFLSNGEPVIVKPNSGYKGLGIILIRDRHDIKRFKFAYRKIYQKLGTGVLIQEAIDTFKLRTDSGLFSFDIRAYVFFGKFIEAHIRRAGRPVGKGPWEAWGISNVAQGGMYVPMLINRETRIIRWTGRPLQVYHFKNIFIDKFAFVFDDTFWRKLMRASETIVRRISSATEQLGRC